MKKLNDNKSHKRSVIFIKMFNKEIYNNKGNGGKVKKGQQVYIF